jgi:uncharacterized protein (TIGR03663 family)
MKAVPRLLAALTALLILSAGAWLRFHALGDRPMHTDEAVQAVKFGDLLERGHYRYDPVEYHGPILYYAALLPARALGLRTLAEVNETQLRAVTALAGLLLLVVLLALGRVWDRPAALAAAGFCALSPGMVYYARYFIQETFLLLGTAGLALCLIGYARARRGRWALGAGLFAALLHISKETCVIAYAGAGAALLVAYVQARRRPTRADRAWAGIALGVVAAVSITFFSSFFTHARGPLDSLLTYGNYLGKSGQEVHGHPAAFYLRLLAGWAERGAPLFHERATLGFALVGLLLAVARPHLPGAATARAVAVYFLVVAAAYFSFRYKTPWLVLNLLLPLHLLAGWGVAALVRASPWRRPAAGLVAVLLGWTVHDLAGQNRFAQFRFPAGPRNPFAYVHTGRDLPRLGEQIRAVAALAPPERPLTVAVMSPEYWPLPWYLRSLPQVGYWYEAQPAAGADILVLDPDYSALYPALPDTHHATMAGVRPGVALHAWFRREAWDRYLETRRGPASPAAPGRGGPPTPPVAPPP